MQFEPYRLARFMVRFKLHSLHSNCQYGSTSLYSLKGKLTLSLQRLEPKKAHIDRTASVDEKMTYQQKYNKYNKYTACL